MDTVKIEKGIAKLPEALKIREAVFITEQGFEIDLDEHDEGAYHIVIYRDQKPVATARAFAEEDRYHIGRVAVLKEYRKQGLGKQLMLGLEAHLQKAGVKQLYLGAQMHAQPFYEGLGYRRFGEVFLDEGNPHIHMQKFL